jgi:hypothetical protein
MPSVGSHKKIITDAGFHRNTILKKIYIYMSNGGDLNEKKSNIQT